MEITTFKPKANKKYKPLYSYLFPAKSSSPLKIESPIIEDYEYNPIINFKEVIPSVNKFDIFKDKVYISIPEDLKKKSMIILYTYDDENFETHYFKNLNELSTINFKHFYYIGLYNKHTTDLDFYDNIKDFMRDYWPFIDKHEN